MTNLPAEDLRHILAHTAPLWERLRGGRLFLTGGTGFFGCWLLESFAAANDAFALEAEAVALTRDPERFAAKAPHLAAHPSIRLLRGDVTDFPFPTAKTGKPENFSHIIHAAATSGGPVTPGETVRTILHGTERVLAFAAACGASQLLFVSSGAVYGVQPPGLTHLPETFTGAPSLDFPAPPPLTIYGESKRMAELLCALACREHRERPETGLEIKIARCFAFVGPHLPLDAHFAIGNFLRDALRGKPIHIQGDGTPLRSYLYAADLAIWLWTILFNGQPARPYNVGSPWAISIRELANTVAAQFNLPVTAARQPDPAIPPARYVPDTARARDELGLEAWIPLEEAIRRTAAWHS